MRQKTLFGANRYSNIDQLRETAIKCNFCPLRKYAKNIVFGDGNEHAEVLILGQNPGVEEDKKGIPFVGKTGQILRTLLSKTDLLKHDNIFITNSILCHTPNNRAPTISELKKCQWPEQIIALIKPKLIVTVGATAVKKIMLMAKRDLKDVPPMAELVGKLYEIALDIPYLSVIFNTYMYVVYHPSYYARGSISYTDYAEMIRGIDTAYETVIGGTNEYISKEKR